MPKNQAKKVFCLRLSFLHFCLSLRFLSLHYSFSKKRNLTSVLSGFIASYINIHSLAYRLSWLEMLRTASVE